MDIDTPNASANHRDDLSVVPTRGAPKLATLSKREAYEFIGNPNEWGAGYINSIAI
jgi:hypothetical protein